MRTLMVESLQERPLFLLSDKLKIHVTTTGFYNEIIRIAYHGI